MTDTLLASANRDNLQDDDHIATLRGTWHRVGDLRAAAAAAANRTFRANETQQHSYAPPDIYAAPLKALRAELPHSTVIPLDARGVPDPYSEGLKAMQAKLRGEK